MSAKDLIIKPISSTDANGIIKRLHYSGKVVPNSQLHFGVFWKGKLEGALQYGPSMRKDNMLHLVEGAEWNGFIELNRMAFSEKLPRNSESRAIAISIKLIKKNYKHIKWILSFADGTQCGDGTIYRASGFVLTGIKKNIGMRIDPDTGEVVSQMTAYHNKKVKEFNNWKALDGYQFRYIYFIEKDLVSKLSVPVIPFSEIEERGIGMYKGLTRGKHAMVGAPNTAGVKRSPPRSKLKSDV